MENTLTQHTESPDQSDGDVENVSTRSLESSSRVSRFGKWKILRLELLILLPVALMLGTWFPALKLDDPQPIFTVRMNPAVPYNPGWVAISPDTRLVAANTDQNEKPGAVLSDIATGRPRAVLVGHGRWTLCGAFSADGRMLATGGMDYKAKLWDTNTGRELATLDANGCTVRSVAFSEDGTRLATGAEVLVSGQIVGTELKLWDVATGQVTATIACVGFGTPLAFSPDGTTLAVATGELLLVDVAAAQTIGKLPGSGTTCVAFSPDGRLLATGEIGWDSKTSHHSGNVRLWDLSTRREQAVFKGHSDWVSALSFSPDGQTLASASWDGSVILWNTESGARQATIAGHTVPLLIKASEVVYGSRPSSRFRVNSVVISRDGKQIAVAHEDGIVDVWDRETIEKLSRQSR